jgi:hypothetical protein
VECFLREIAAGFEIAWCLPHTLISKTGVHQLQLSLQQQPTQQCQESDISEQLA